MLFKVLIFVTCLLQFVWTQKVSPCPEVLTYEINGKEPDRWYGNLKITTNTPLYGVWLRIVLDQPADLLGNWFGETTTLNNQAYVITNRNYELKPNEPLKLRFFVKHNTKNPNIKEITLNGKKICFATTETPAPEKPQVQLESNSAILEQVPSIPDECGTVKVAGQPLITSGDSTFEGQWPWHVAVYRSKETTFKYVCGGSLISAKHVLTAAQCVVQPRRKEPFDSDLFIIYLGKHSLDNASPNVQNNGVRDISVHPDYDSTYFYNNIAVLHLNYPAKITDFVRPICLWDGDRNLNKIVGKSGTIVGWGYDENATPSDYLVQASMKIVDTPTCVYSNRPFFSKFTSPTTYCAGFRNGTAACVGDNGGGMVFRKEVNGNINWHLRGIISTFKFANTKLVCDIASYTVFTDVAQHLDWIKNIIKN